ncbi:putative bifunctional diguanylate cyclase/phosphodiesterase [Deinococcus sp. UYEF24]
MLLVLAAFPLSWLALRWGPESWQLGLADTLYVPVFLGAALVCGVRARRSRGRARLAWSWVAAAPLCFGLGQSYWAFLEVWQARSPFPSAADGLFLLQPVVMGIGLLLFPRSVLSRADALKRRLDVGIVIVAVLTLAWFGLGRHIVHTWQGQPVAMLISLAYPALDVWLLTILLWNALHLRERRHSGSASRSGIRSTDVLLTCSVLSAVVADVGFALTYGLPDYQVGNLNDLFWTLSASFLGLAALVGRPETGRTTALAPPGPADVREGVQHSLLSRRLGAYGPYLALGSCYLMLFLSLGSSEHMSLLLGASVVTVLVVVRQMIGQLENERLTFNLQTLSRSLEGRVRERTAELEAAGRVLRDLTGELDARVMERTVQLEASQAQLAYQTRHDALTGLPNRSLFEERLDRTLQEPGEGLLTAVLYLNLDGFKAVNDHFGHAVGDDLLRDLARRLQGLLRPPEDQVQSAGLGLAGPGRWSLARCGGDEFVLAFPDLARPEDAESCARRIAAVIGNDFTAGGQQVTLTASIGVSLAPTDALQAAELIRQADMAMSQAKAGGKNTLRFYAPQMNRAAQERSTIGRRLRLALETQELAPPGNASRLDQPRPDQTEPGQTGLSLQYQPQYRLQDMTFSEAGIPACPPSGFEALLRWTDAELGVVSPSVFVPVAEDTGLIVPLGQWVLEQACSQLRQWPGSRVAVNVAAAQFERPEFVQEVSAALERHGVPGASLELELTERQVVSDPDGTARKMRELRELGVQIALDDFGVGYSSLSHLLKLPVSVLKVDRLFVKGLHEVTGAPRVLQAIVALAHALGVRVVAEGVETGAQLGTVRELGCDLVQGFLTGRPLDPQEAGALLRLPADRPSL